MTKPLPDPAGTPLTAEERATRAEAKQERLARKLAAAEKQRDAYSAAMHELGPAVAEALAAVRLLRGGYPLSELDLEHLEGVLTGKLQASVAAHSDAARQRRRMAKLTRQRDLARARVAELTAELNAATTPPATVFLAWGGEYDERDVRKIFARRPDADAYDCADDVEEWPVQPGPVETRRWYHAVWQLSDPTAPANTFDWVNPFDHPSDPGSYATSEPREYDGHADTVHIDWAPGSTTMPWIVQFEGWDADRILAAWKERRDRIVAAGGKLPLPLDKE